MEGEEEDGPWLFRRCHCHHRVMDSFRLREPPFLLTASLPFPVETWTLVHVHAPSSVSRLPSAARLQSDSELVVNERRSAGWTMCFSSSARPTFPFIPMLAHLPEPGHTLDQQRISP